MSNRTGTHILGRLWEADGAGVVRIENRYDTDIDDLWSAITDPERLARWYGHVEGDLREGGEFRVHIAPAEIEGTGRVHECDPPRRLRVTTRETDESAHGGGDEPFDEIAEATLTPDGDQTVLVIEIRGLPLQKLAAYGAGWQMHAEALAAYLAGRDPSVGPDRWGELIPAYAAMAPRESGA
ncbi:MAG TPA: SRPBCC family protein [Nocardioidaceae bacterium]|nr:SRPBCC family protein [Nocardioidaceae bacterium]